MGETREVANITDFAFKNAHAIPSSSGWARAVYFDIL